MLRITVSKSANAAKQYFNDALSKGDYYFEGREHVGYWHGNLKERFSLSDSVEKEVFFKLIDNINPVDDSKLNPRGGQNRRVGYDVTYSVPKSISLAYDHLNDERILEAFRESVHETMQEMESHMCTQDYDESRRKIKPITGNMLWAEFVHFESRPVDGVPDPHLHAHCYVMNTTYHARHERFQACEIYDIHRSAPYYQAAFDARMANKMGELGYAVERTYKGWELVGVPREMIEEFSKRTEQVEREARKREIYSASIKDTLASETRDLKSESLPYEDVQRIKKERLGEEGARILENLQHHESDEGIRITASEAVDYAIAHAFERASVVPLDRIKAYALEYGIGSVSVEEIEQEVFRGNILTKRVDHRDMATLPEIIESEQAIAAFCLEDQGRSEALVKGEYTCKDPIFEQESAKQQKEAVLHVLSSQNRVIGVDGVAGGGKTTLMEEAIRGIEASGTKVFTFAPSSNASRIVLKSKGFEEATTVADLTSSELQTHMKGQVLWVDEAGLLSVNQMHEVFKRAEELEVKKIILSGDIQQHGAVERGNGFKTLIDEGNLHPAKVKKVQRQNVETHKPYHDTVVDLSRGDVDRAFDRLEKMEAIKEEEYYLEEAAKHYAEHIDEAVLVSPTHMEGGLLTGLVRDRMKEKGMLQGEDRRFETQRNLSWTQAQRADSTNYEQEGLIVQFSKKVEGFRKSERVQVVGCEEGTVLVSGSDGQVKPLDLEKAGAFDVFSRRETDLAIGDRIRITRNGFVGNKRLDNGTIHEVMGFTSGGHVQLDGGVTLPKDYANFTHGYCTTSHGSQGMDNKMVIAAIGGTSLPAVSDQQMYVTVSRGREEVYIYTDDAMALRKSVKDSVKMSAMEFTRAEETTVREISRYWTKGGQEYEASREVDRAREAARGEYAWRGAIERERGMER